MSPERRRRRRLELAAWAALIGLNLLSHFWSLGSRAMSHDESLHAFYSHELAARGEYKHDPMMHGPLLFHASALVFALLGESDATARLYAAVPGVLLIAVLFALRRYLGRSAALLCALLLSLSPSVLFYGRYHRNDVPISLLSVLWLLWAFRYLESRRPRFLLLMAGAMALSFCAKETSFIFGAIVGVFFVALALVRRVRLGEALGKSAAAELAVVMLTLVLPFAAALGHHVLGYDPRAFDDPVTVRRSLLSIGGLLLLGAATAALTLRRSLGTWARAQGIFGLIVAALYTTFLTNAPRGIVSGVMGSLGYWLSQHSTARGSQPWYYYLFLGAFYELLPLALGTAAMVVALRGGFGQGRRRRFALFLSWWAVASLVAYSLAGEKMPWLLVHVVLPFTLLGGLALARLIAPVLAARPGLELGLLGLATPGLVLLLLGPMLWLTPFGGRDSEAVSRTARYFFHLVAGASLASFTWGRLAALGAARRRLLVLGAASFLALVTARSALMLAFTNADLATEYLVYAHGTPDLKRAMAEIDEVAARTGLGARLEVAYDDDSAWPLTWYLRAYPKQRYYGDTPTSEAMSLPIVIVGKKNFEKAEPFLDRGYVRRDYRLVWWPIEDYARLGWKDVAAVLRDARVREDLLQVLLYRRHPKASLAEWPYRHEFRLYIRRDLVERVWPLGPPVAEAAGASQIQILPERRCKALAEYAGPYAGRGLLGPSAVAVAEDGARLVADTGNHRVLILERDGALRAAVGERCDLDNDSLACDGRFHEPWGIAPGMAGEILVADTWNGRVQILDAGGRFLRAFGRLGLDQPPPVPVDRLYGPRGIAFDFERRRVIVSDTGHKRVLAFDPTGRNLIAAGGGGTAPGRFEEPVGIAVDPRDASVLVADAWNGRVQRLSPELGFVASWAVPGWGSRDPADKPSLAVDARGNVYASVPAKARVLVFDPDGVPLVSLAGADWAPGLARPTGLAVDPASGELLVADRGRNRIVVLNALRSAEEQCR